MKYKKTLFAFEEDIKTRGFRDWLEAHTSWMKPLHRYNGELVVTDEKLIFSGKDKRKKEDIDFEIQISDIKNIHLGFDDTFKRREDRQIGLFGFVPLRIDYMDESEDKKLYVFAHFHHPYGLRRHSKNKKVYEHITDKI